jgi:predicted kinase
MLTQVNAVPVEVVDALKGMGRPLVVGVMGQTAAGKSTLGRALGEWEGFTYLSQSACKLALKPEWTEADNLDEGLRDQGYRLVLELTEGEVRRGRVPVVDAGWHRRRRREWLYETCRRPGAALLLIYVTCSDLGEVQRRLRLRAERQAGVDDIAASMATYWHIDREFEEVEDRELTEGPRAAWIRVETAVASGAFASMSRPVAG